jgi:hypothetical protein
MNRIKILLLLVMLSVSACSFKTGVINVICLPAYSVPVFGIGNTCAELLEAATGVETDKPTSGGDNGR